jgi:hypothetical protein
LSFNEIFFNFHINSFFTFTKTVFYNFYKHNFAYLLSTLRVPPGVRVPQVENRFRDSLYYITNGHWYVRRFIIKINLTIKCSVTEEWILWMYIHLRANKTHCKLQIAKLTKARCSTKRLIKKAGNFV